MARRSQKDIVRELLRERGATGVSAHELTYGGYGITRAAAIVWELRHEEGMNIVTDNEKGLQARYTLLPSRASFGDTLVRAPRREAPPELPGQGGFFEDSELPAISWTELGEKLRA